MWRAQRYGRGARRPAGPDGGQPRGGVAHGSALAGPLSNRGACGAGAPAAADLGVRRTRAELVALVEGLALRQPQPSVATITRRARQAAGEHGWAAPSYSTVYAIVWPPWTPAARLGPRQPREVSRPLRIGLPPSRPVPQRRVTGRPHPARRAGGGRRRPACAALADARARRSLPSRSRLLALPRRAVGVEPLAGAAPGHLARAAARSRSGRQGQ